MELIEKYKRWKLDHANDDADHEDDSDKDSDMYCALLTLLLPF